MPKVLNLWKRKNGRSKKKSERNEKASKSRKESVIKPKTGQKLKGDSNAIYSCIVQHEYISLVCV